MLTAHKNNRELYADAIAKILAQFPAGVQLVYDNKYFGDRWKIVTTQDGPAERFGYFHLEYLNGRPGRFYFSATFEYPNISTVSGKNPYPDVIGQIVALSMIE